MRRLVLLAAAAAVLVGAPSPAATSASARPEVHAASSAFGRILFDGRGFVLYAFTHDTRGKSRCAGACARAWPPFLVTKLPRAGAGVRSTFLGTTRRADGRLQVTFAGRPLYYYAGDQRPGQIRCQNVAEYGGVWRVVRPAGSLVG